MIENCRKIKLMSMSVLSLSILGMANAFGNEVVDMDESGIMQDSASAREEATDTDQIRAAAAFPARFEVDGQATIYQDTDLNTTYAGGRFFSTGIDVLLNYSAILGGISYESMALYGSNHNQDIEAKLAMEAEFVAYGLYGRADVPGPTFPHVAYGVYGTTNHLYGYGVYAGNTAPAGDFGNEGGGTSLYATGSINGAFTNGGLYHIDNHVAIIENTVPIGANAHVLALSIPYEINPGSADNFITFYANGSDSGDAVGSVEGNSFSGVTYNSGSADFAEWIPRLNPEELIEAGDIVGLAKGKVSRNLQQFDHIKVVSTAPAFTGNDPGFDKRDQYELVAMIGQVPVKVTGVVNAGDYIVASGKNDGTGIAVTADRMTPDHFHIAVGRAWESSTEQGVKLVNTAVGLEASDTYAYMHKQDQRIASLERQLSGKLEKLDRLAARMEALARKVAHIQSDRFIASATLAE